MKKKTINLKTIIVVTLYPFEVHLKTYINQAIEDLVDTKIAFTGEFMGNIVPRTIVTKEKDLGHAQITFDADIEYGLEKIDNESEQEFDQRMELEITLEFKRQVRMLLRMFNLAWPGALKCYKMIVVVKNEKVETDDSFYSLHRESIDFLNEKGWTVYRTVPFKKMVDWFDRYGYSFTRRSASNVERGLNAYTYLFRAYGASSVLDLIYALVGIEALYAVGEKGIKQKITGRTQAYLKPPVDFSGYINDMYKFRSKFIHGELDFLPADHEHDDLEDEFSNREFHSTILAVALLTATIQEMIIRDKNQVE